MGEAWNKTPRIGVGDISRQFGDRFSPHNCHRNGLEVDVRYVRSDGVEGPFDFTQNPISLYDQAATQQLVDLFIQHGAVLIIVDPDSGLTGPGVTVDMQRGHRNHFHVRISDPDGTAN